MNLLLTYESSTLAAPQSFKDAMQTAVNILDSTIKDNITLNIQVGYGDWDNGVITGLTTGAVGGDLYGSYVSYTTLRAALASHETSTVDQAFVNSLPNTTSVNGVSSLYVPSAVEKALGMISPTASAMDGAVGIGTAIPTADLVGVALHELTHAFGREPGTATFDLGRYTTAGNHLFSGASTAPPAYFSIDGGVTRLADYGQNSDPSDFLNSGVQGPNDPFNEFYSASTVQSLSTVDKQLLDTLGFNVTGTAPAGPSAATSSIVASSPTVTADGTSTTMLTVTVKDALGNAVAGTAVTLSASGSSNTFGAISGITDATGVFKTTLASTLAQNETITATEGSAQESTSVSFLAGSASAALSSIVASSPTVIADGTSKTILTVTVEDAHGNAVAGTAVTLSASGSSNIFGTLSGVTDSHGLFTTTMASAMVQNEIITATEGSVHETAALSFVPATAVAQIGSNYYLYTNGAGPELKFAGSPYVTGEFGSWSPFAAVQTTSGYDVAWKNPSSGTYTVWSADSNGNWISDLISNVTASSTALQSIETTFHQDLNGDGLLGVPTIMAQANVPTSVAQIGSNYYLYTNGSGPELKFAGSAYVTGEFGSWSPFAAVQTTSGYDVAWKNPTSATYTVWSADSNGNWISDLISNVTGSSKALQSIETTFHQDLNGDGVIGLPPIVAQPSGTSVAQIGSNYYLYTNGSGPELKFAGSAYVTGEFGSWSPFAAVQTTSGYDVAWKNATSGTYTVWNADSNGNWVSDLISNVPGSSSKLQSIETTFHQDLNGDGVIGVPLLATTSPAAINTAAVNLPGGPASVTVAAGHDAFMFAPNFGQIAISNFALETDTIQFSKASFADILALQAATHNDGLGNAVIADAAHNTLIIEHVTAEQLYAHQNDFHLV